MVNIILSRAISSLARGTILVTVPILLAVCSSSGLSGKGPAAYLEHVRTDPVRLEAFVREMPKGGDIHTHLSGIPDAESYLRWAAADGMCINTTSWAIGKAPCGDGTIPVSTILSNPQLAGRAIDTLSMRHFPLVPPRFGHDHFFATFPLFDAAINGYWPEILAEAATKAASDNTDYLELFRCFEPDVLYSIADKEPWTSDMEAWYRAVIEPIRALVPSQTAHIDEILGKARSILGCETAAPAAACNVNIRFIHQAVRFMPNHQVFVSLMLGAELASRDPRVVGVDLVYPEDHPYSLANYTQHMKMLAFLKGEYPSLNINLHAGELSPALVGPRDLSFHITEAVKTAGAQRIGHGVSIKYEPGWQELLADMARRRIGVTLLFTSNAQILGIAGEDHPFRTYMAAGVPVVISTDDQGVSRGSHTGEFLRAIMTYGLTWNDLKTLIRTSLDISFLAGQGLWKTPGAYTIPVNVCASDIMGGPSPSPSCKAFLKANDKAAEQWRLEGRLAAFEERRW